MSKNKLIVFFLVLVLSISMLSGCSSKSTVSTKTPDTEAEKPVEQVSDGAEKIQVFLNEENIEGIIDDRGHPIVKLNNEELTLEELEKRGYGVYYREDAIIIKSPENNGNGTGVQNVGDVPEEIVNPENQGSASATEIPDIVRDISPKEGKISDAGAFYEGETHVPMPTLNPSDDIDAVKDSISEYLFYVYGYRFLNGEMTPDYMTVGPRIDIVQNDDGLYGILIAAWRTTYASDSAQNIALNAVLASMYYLCGDKEVASALWNLTDSAYIGHEFNSEDFGFQVIDGYDLSDTSHFWTMTMNDTTIYCQLEDGIFTYYFS
jgi:hypothetical protein